MRDRRGLNCSRRGESSAIPSSDNGKGSVNGNTSMTYSNSRFVFIFSDNAVIIRLVIRVFYDYHLVFLVAR